MSYQVWSVVFGEQPSASKWNILGTNDAAFNDGTGLADDSVIARIIADGAVLPNHLKASASSSNDWVWDSYTPTVPGLTLGNGTRSGRYMRVGNTVFFEILIIFGSTSSMSGDGSCGLPLAAHARYDLGNSILGMAQFATPATNPGSTRLESSTEVRPIVWNVAGTYATESGVSSTVPFTWGTGDIMFMQGMYECAV